MPAESWCSERGSGKSTCAPTHLPNPPGVQRSVLHPALTAGSAARSKQHLEVVFAVLPAFELQMGQQRKFKQTPIIAPSWPVFVGSGPALGEAREAPQFVQLLPAGSGVQHLTLLPEKASGGGGKELEDRRGGGAERKASQSSRGKAWRWEGIGRNWPFPQAGVQSEGSPRSWELGKASLPKAEAICTRSWPCWCWERAEGWDQV